MLLQFAGSSWDELKYIRQAVGFLVSKHFRQHNFLFLGCVVDRRTIYVSYLRSIVRKSFGMRDGETV